ncbi:DDE-1 domain-containing protein [Trichonephila clavipes]|nr:DDE-1 domain-containing protein [Trichonephila clavipes]
MVGLPPHASHRLQPLDVLFFGPLKTYYSQACDNFRVTHPGQTITDKYIGDPLSTAYFKAATVGNAMKGFKECGIEPHNPLLLSEHGFDAAKTTDHDVVGDATEINSANPQTLAVENQHKNPSEEPELIANADSDAPKSTPLKEMLEQKGKAEGRTGNFKKNRQEKLAKQSNCINFKDGVIRCPACEEEYFNPPTEEWRPVL